MIPYAHFPTLPEYSARQSHYHSPPVRPPFAPLTLPLLPGVDLDRLVATFDVDDVLWPLNVTCARIVGVDYSKCHTFAIRENRYYTDAEKDAIFQQFRDAKMFEQLPFYPGVARIAELHQQGIRVCINSKSSTVKIANIKYTRLLQVLPFLTDSDLNLIIYGQDSNTTTGKNVGPETTFFIDDSPYNITTSGAIYNLVPCKPYNTNPDEIQLMRDKNFYLQSGLDCIIETITRSVHFWREHR